MLRSGEVDSSQAAALLRPKDHVEIIVVNINFLFCKIVLVWPSQMPIFGPLFLWLGI